MKSIGKRTVCTIAQDSGNESLNQVNGSTNIRKGDRCDTNDKGLGY